MEVVHTNPDIRYRYEVLCCTIPIPISGLEVKVTNLEKYYVNGFVFFYTKCDLGELYYPATALIFHLFTTFLA